MINNNLEFIRLNSEHMEIWTVETPESFPVQLCTIKIPLPEFFDLEKAIVEIKGENMCISEGEWEVLIPLEKVENKWERKIYDPTHLPSDPTRSLDQLLGQYIYNIPVQNWVCERINTENVWYYIFRGDKRGNFCLYIHEFPENITLYTIRTPYQMRSSLKYSNPIHQILVNIEYKNKINIKELWLIGAMMDNCNATISEFVSWKEMFSGEISIPSKEVWKSLLIKEVPYSPRFLIGGIYITRAWKLVSPLREVISWNISQEQWQCLKAIAMLQEMKHKQNLNCDMAEKKIPYAGNIWFYL